MIHKTEVFRLNLNGVKMGWTAGIPSIGLALFLFLPGLIRGIEDTATPADTVMFVLYMLLIGFSEETLFRGLLKNAFHRFFGEDSKVHALHDGLITVEGGALSGKTITNILGNSDGSSTNAKAEIVVTTFIIIVSLVIFLDITRRKKIEPLLG